MNIRTVIILLSISTLAMSVEFASQLRKCRVNDKVALNQCLFHTLEDLRPTLRTGIPELNLPALDPMKVNNLVFQHGDGAVRVEATFTDAIITGLSGFNTTMINADPVSRTLRVGLRIPQLRIIGNYVLDGQIIILSISGNGPFRANLNDVHVTGLSRVELVKTPTGGEKLTTSGSNLDLTIRSINIRLENLFNGDQILGETVNHFLNENSQEIFREVKPEVIRQLGTLVETVINDALSQLPVDAFLQ